MLPDSLSPLLLEKPDECGLGPPVPCTSLNPEMPTGSPPVLSLDRLDGGPAAVQDDSTESPSRSASGKIQPTQAHDSRSPRSSSLEGSPGRRGLRGMGAWTSAPQRWADDLMDSVGAIPTDATRAGLQNSSLQKTQCSVERWPQTKSNTESSQLEGCPAAAQPAARSGCLVESGAGAQASETAPSRSILAWGGWHTIASCSPASCASPIASCRQPCRAWQEQFSSPSGLSRRGTSHPPAFPSTARQLWSPASLAEASRSEMSWTPVDHRAAAAGPTRRGKSSPPEQQQLQSTTHGAGAPCKSPCPSRSEEPTHQSPLPRDIGASKESSRLVSGCLAVCRSVPFRGVDGHDEQYACDEGMPAENNRTAILTLCSTVPKNMRTAMLRDMVASRSIADGSLAGAENTNLRTALLPRSSPPDEGRPIATPSEEPTATPVGGPTQNHGCFGVSLHVYDVSKAKRIQRVNRVLAHRKSLVKFGGVFHAGVEVNGLEWSFGKSECASVPGICCVKPRSHPQHSYRQTVRLPSTLLTAEEIAAVISDLVEEYPGQDYDLLRRNCCHFADDFCQRLGVGRIPSWVHRLARLGARIDRALKRVRSVGLHSRAEAPSRS